jgi:replicative DNA helicase
VSGGNNKLDPSTVLAAQLDRPPCSPEAEASIIGGLLLDSLAWDKIVDELRHSDFYLKKNQIIFSCIQKLQDENQNVDALTVAERLQQDNQLAAIGGVDYISSIVTSTASSANIKSYAEIIRNKSILRKLLTVSSDIVTTVRNPDGASTKDILDIAEKSVYLRRSGT